MEPVRSSLSTTYNRIYSVVATIPRGRVATYGQVAELAGVGPGARQVGYALSALPAATNLPWHRVVNAEGRISARATSGGDRVQRAYLEQEGVKFGANGRIPLDRFQWRPSTG
jgi:methylated-DNA-protein-cysteine methyltransferase-like protein